MPSCWCVPHGRLGARTPSRYPHTSGREHYAHPADQSAAAPGEPAAGRRLKPFLPDNHTSVLCLYKQKLEGLT